MVENDILVEYDNMVDQIIKESYFGKNDILINCEKELDKLIIFRKNNKNYSMTDNIHNKSIEKLLRELFGFKEVYITWVYRNVPNAYTFVNSHIIFTGDVSLEIRKNKGFYDKNHNDVCTIFIFSHLIDNLNLSSKELLSLILHEIGHNFDYSPYNFSVFIRKILDSYGVSILFEALFSPNNKEKIVINKRKLIDKDLKRNNQIKDKINNYNKNMMIWLKIFFLPLGTIISTISASFLIPIACITKKLKISTIIPSEMYADSFATSYGYGTELISALQKMTESNSKQVIDRGGIQLFLFDLSHAQSEFMIALTDIHGSNQQRCKNLIIKLKNDLNSNDFSPQVKKQLEREIDSLEKSYEKIINDIEYNKYMPSTAYMRSFIDKVFNGSPTISSSDVRKYQV